MPPNPAGVGQVRVLRERVTPPQREHHAAQLVERDLGVLVAAAPAEFLFVEPARTLEIVDPEGHQAQTLLHRRPPIILRCHLTAVRCACARAGARVCTPLSAPEQRPAAQAVLLVGWRRSGNLKQLAVAPSRRDEDQTESIRSRILLAYQRTQCTELLPPIAAASEFGDPLLVDAPTDQAHNRKRPTPAPEAWRGPSTVRSASGVHLLSPGYARAGIMSGISSLVSCTDGSRQFRPISGVLPLYEEHRRPGAAARAA